MKYTFTILDQHYLQIREHFEKGAGKERVSFIICGLSRVDDIENRFLAKEIINVPEAELISSQTFQVTWNNNLFIKYLKYVETKNLTIAIIHNHNSENDHFSSVDDQGEYELFRLAYNRNGKNKPYASLILLPDGSIIGRVWKPDLSYELISKIRVIGNLINIYYPARTCFYSSPEAFDRQRLAFGDALIQDFSNLKVSIVGLGATG